MVKVKLVRAGLQETLRVLLKTVGGNRPEEIDVGSHADLCRYRAPRCRDWLAAMGRGCLDRNQHRIRARRRHGREPG